MRFDNSPLFIGMQNDQVGQLHEILRLLEFPIPADELEQARFGEGTRLAVANFQTSRGLWPSGIVVDETAIRLPRLVRGQVRQANGAPLAGWIVRAFDRNLRQGDRPIGASTVSDETGHYQIAYEPWGLGYEGKHYADLIVAVDNANLAGPIFGAGLVEVVDLTLNLEESVDSEYTQVRSQVEHVLAPQGLALSEVQAEELDFLAGATELDRDRVRWLVASEKAAQTTSIPASVFYGLFQQTLVDDLSALLRQDGTRWRHALLSAIDDNIIPSSLRDQLGTILAEQFPAQRVEELLRPAQDGHAASLGDLLAVMPNPLSDLQRHTLVKLLDQATDYGDQFWSAMRAEGFEDFQIGRIQATLLLGTLTQNHPSLIHLLHRRFEFTSPADLRQLVWLSREEWDLLVSQSGLPPGFGDSRQYAQKLQQSVEELYPTAAIAARLDQLPVEAEARHDLALFFRKNPGFELGRELVGAYLEEGGGAILTDIDPNNIPRLKEQLLPLERIVKVAKRPDDMHVLLSEGFDSAYKIVNLGRRDFHAVLADRLDGDTARIEAIYNNAEQNVAMSLALIARYSQTYNNTAVAVVSTSAVTTTPAPDPARGIADMRTLFGNQDFCTCDDCRSVYSPAAYLVDLLYYLSKRKISNGQSLKDVLLARRPDVAEIELSCENTNTRLPYIDLVNEVLENAVAVRPAGSPYPQTSWSEEELSANPEHVNVKAYDDYLGSAFYPWTLPFNFWMKEARTYLEHLGVQRYQLMETVQPALRLTDYAVACESLGLTKENAELITASTANPPAPWQLWGFPTDQVQNFPDRRAGITRSGQWSDLLKIVSLFLQQSAITYTELLNLLQMRYITAQIAAGLSLLLQGDVCNPGTMEIAGLNPAILARIPRFVRLWRQLGWKMHDLDKAIAVFPGAEITEDLILWLSHIQRLRAYHNVTVVTVLSWWSNVDSFAYLDFTEGSPVPVVPLYHRLFLNRTVSTVSVPDLEIDPVTGDLKGTNKKITEYPAAVLAGLGISAADLALLFAKQVPSSTNPTQMVPLVPDKLTLKNLSTLYRIASLTRALGMSIRDWLVVTALTGLDPFADISNVAKGSDSSLATLKFVEEVTFIHASDFNALELDFLLRLQQSRTALVGPSVQQIASVLSDIRRGLREISIQTTVAADDTGERVKRGLALLAWPEQLAAELFSADLLSSSPRFVVPIARLPANLIPAALQGKLTYDAHSQQLVCLGALRQQERDDILNLLVDWTQPEYRAVKQAVEALYADAAQITPNRVKVAAARLQSFELPSFIVGWLTTDLASLPTGLTLPDDLPVELKALVSYDAGSQKLQFKGLMMATERAKLISLAGVDQSFIDAVERLFVPVNFPVELAEHFYYDRTARELRFVGWMTASQRQQLRGLTPATSFQDAVDDLFTQASRYQENTVANQFLTKSDVEQLFYDARSLPMRFELILQKLMPYLRIRLSRNLVVQQLAQALALEVQTVAELLTQPQRLVWPNHTDQAGQPEPAVMAFLDPTFANSSLNDSLTPIAFGDQFAMVTRISQVVLPLTKLQVKPEQVVWLFPANQDVYGFNRLPLQPAPSASLVQAGYACWKRLVELFLLRDALPAGALVLDAIFVEANRAGATATSIRQEIGRLLSWNEEDLEQATRYLQFGFPDDYRDPVKLRQLTAYFKLLKRLGSSADQLWQWAGPTLSATQATAIKQTARARFDDTAWLERAQPLRNMLRAEQREALLAYLVANLPVRDANDLFGRYLIDVEMDPCMLTSRIKQAISSVQLFVQRCLMNLENEQSVPPSAVDLDQWNWMKNYRVWEANRKVFVYPENWIEPELRDDKTPFFTELESELLQGDITADKAEQAFSLYLEKLDEVAHLEIVGMFHESGDTGATDVLHVFGRTFGTPHVYYYRRCVDASRWATWKRDESGAHSIKLREATSLFANQWSAWERVDLDIEGDHLIPVVWKQRLYLFWAVFLEKAREPDTLESQKGKKPDKDWEIQLGWSEYRNGRWSAKKLGPQAPFKHPERIYEGIDWTQVFAKEKFFFKGISGADELTIWCYGPAEVS